MIDQPAWVTVVLGVLAYLIAPTPVIYLLLRSRRKYVQKNHSRMAAMEKVIDPDRESSDPSPQKPEKEE